MNSTTRRIVAAFRLAGEPGRRKLEGFLRYMAENKLDWQLQFVRIREDFNADFVKSFAERGIDGVVYSLPAAKDGAAELVRLDLPTIALDIFDEAVCSRLVTTNDTMDNIASSCGFPKLDRLRAAFKGKYGMTMPEYRAQAKAGR